MKTSTRDLSIVAAIAALIIAVGIWYCSPLIAEPNNWPKETFSQERWRTVPASERYRLVRDLFDRQLLVAKSSVDVETLLGKPTYASQDGSYWLYTVKERAPNDTGFDAVKMVHIDFDGNKLVLKSWVRGD